MLGLAKRAPAGRRIAPALAARAPAGGWMTREQASIAPAISVELWSESRAEGESAMATVMLRRSATTASDSEDALISVRVRGVVRAGGCT